MDDYTKIATIIATRVKLAQQPFGFGEFWNNLRTGLDTTGVNAFAPSSLKEYSRTLRRSLKGSPATTFAIGGIALGYLLKKLLD